MKKIKVLFMVVIFILSIASVGISDPILNNPFDGIEQLSAGIAYGYYQNSGDLLFTAYGNNGGAHFAAMQAALNSISGYQDVVLSLADVSVAMFTNSGAQTGGASNSGTWTVNPSASTIEFYAVKASNAYAMYVVDPADNTGSWSTYDIWQMLRFDEKNPFNGDSLEISHLTGYNPGTSVPEPGMLLLFGAGLLGLGFFGRKKF